MGEHNELGKKGEKIAQEYLITNGYQILHTNWRTGHLELDIVAQDGGELAVVEVKTRAGLKYGEPEEAVTLQKSRLIIRATHYYIHKFQIEMPVRFDIITVIIDGASYRLEHIKDAFYPPLF